MPAPIWYAHRIVQRQSELRKDGRLPWLRPDAKSQVTFRYVDGKPAEVRSEEHTSELQSLMRISYAVFCLKKKKYKQKQHKQHTKQNNKNTHPQITIENK